MFQGVLTCYDVTQCSRDASVVVAPTLDAERGYMKMASECTGRAHGSEPVHLHSVPLQAYVQGPLARHDFITS